MPLLALSLTLNAVSALIPITPLVFAAGSCGPVDIILGVKEEEHISIISGFRGAKITQSQALHSQVELEMAKNG